MNDINSRTTLPKETIINYSIKYLMLKVLGNLVFVALGFYFIYKIKFDYVTYTTTDYFALLIAFAFIFYYGKIVFKEIFSASNKIIISENGISINNVFHPWKTISKEKIFRRKEYTPKYRSEYEEVFLEFSSPKGNVEVKIDDYAIAEEKITQLLKEYREKFSPFHQVEVKNNIFQNSMGFETYMKLSKKEAKKRIKDILALAETNESELLEYCKTDLLDKLDQLELIYFALSEKYQRWEKFLTHEFIRLFEMAKTSDRAEDLFSLAGEIFPDENRTEESNKACYYLYKELDNQNISIRLNALSLLDFWLDEDKIDNRIVNKIKSKIQDPNWKVRWTAYKILKENSYLNDDAVNISFIDKLRGKCLNPYVA